LLSSGLLRAGNLWWEKCVKLNIFKLQNLIIWSNGKTNIFHSKLSKYVSGSYIVVTSISKRQLTATMFCGFTVKGKAISVQAWTGPEGSRRLRLPDFKTIGT
jgi:hypothetical protein